jgi:hypothetical protein
VVSFALALILIALSPFVSEAADASGYWAKTATAFQEVRDERRMFFPSPNGRTLAIIDGARIWVRVDREVRHLDRDVSVGWPAEIAWSPDSKAFFITQTDSGMVGTWSSLVFLVERSLVRVVNPAKEAVARFRPQYACTTPEEPNAAAIAWLDGGKQLLIATEVPPHASCPQMGKVAGYLVLVPSMRVERELSGEALKREFRALLGPRLTAR